MFVPVCDRPSMAGWTGTQDDDVMETRSAVIHSKMLASPRQLPITGSAHKTTIIGDAREAARGSVATLDVTAEGCGTARRDRSHHACRGSVDCVR